MTAFFVTLALLASGHPTASEIIAKMDDNLTFESRRSRTKMIVKDGRTTRVYEMVGYGRGEDDAAIEYVEPPREKGTRMLKLGDQLWIYMPSVDRVQKISGHMLRQGMMGSDVSYEDLMTSQELEKLYQAEVTGEGNVDGRATWTLELKAKDSSVSYPKRIMQVDKELYIPTEQKLYALSGMLLKTWTMSNVKEFPGGRKYPTKMMIQDHLKKDSSTTLEFTEMEFGVKLQDQIFARRWLQRRGR